MPYFACINNDVFRPDIQSGTLLKKEKSAPTKAYNHTYFGVGVDVFPCLLPMSFRVNYLFGYEPSERG
ncbi:MAG: hypothetical protein DRG87_04885 [Deltaproteobacteria bacterium]|nr:MAG: hypothetical protein DRG87_04885 [Deltaproteobacteria bacterium]